MQEEKHIDALKEVKRAIDEGLKYPKGLLSRQRLLMAGLSLGVQHLIEIWLHRSGAFKPGASLKHEWFAAEERRIKVRLAGIATKDISKLTNTSRILALARQIEQNRNVIVYGATLKDDSVLKEKIDYFIELKKAVEEAVGDVEW